MPISRARRTPPASSGKMRNSRRRSTGRDEDSCGTCSYSPRSSSRIRDTTSTWDAAASAEYRTFSREEVQAPAKTTGQREPARLRRVSVSLRACDGSA
mmetsp:Transcript_27346/g.62785  ORF Transcript_27346/g.62785 Transcript_27346/m.62785 type:complete len:98 (+) Transcript_27346:1987-2280(+)